jgi:hypothetical protein
MVNTCIRTRTHGYKICYVAVGRVTLVDQSLELGELRLELGFWYRRSLLFPVQMYVTSFRMCTSWEFDSEHWTPSYLVSRIIEGHQLVAVVALSPSPREKNTIGNAIRSWQLPFTMTEMRLHIQIRYVRTIQKVRQTFRSETADLWIKTCYYVYC